MVKNKKLFYLILIASALVLVATASFLLNKPPNQETVSRIHIFAMLAIKPGEAPVIDSAPPFINQEPAELLTDVDSPFSILLLDSDDKLLVSYKVGKKEMITGVAIDYILYTIENNVPLPVGTRTLRLIDSRASQPIREWTLSEISPTVKVLGPKEGETFNATIPVSWMGEDSEGDPLVYTVYYSPGGEEWIPVVLFTNETTALLDASDFRGGKNFLIKVEAYDGTFKAEDTSDGPFSLAPQAPQVRITYPDSNAEFIAGQHVAFVGLAGDREDGIIKNSSAFTWSSDVEGYLGTGYNFGTKFSVAGFQTITLQVQDSDGNVSTDSVTILILADTDGDTMPNNWEIDHGLDPRVKDNNNDPDGDGLINEYEYFYQTDPQNRDSDGDGVSDGEEIGQGTNPLE